jgi:hypothetical protein
MKSLASAEVVSETRARLLKVEPLDRALWGRMTAMQMMRHVGCAYEVALGERAVQRVKTRAPRVVKWVALRSGLTWPKNIKTTPELERVNEEPDGVWEELVEAAVVKMEALATRARECDHPIFGPMTATDWQRWGYLHADHHLRQFGR